MIFLGLDCGASALKAALVDEQERASGAHPRGRPRWRRERRTRATQRRNGKAQLMIIAPYRPDELDEIAALVNGAYRGETSKAGWTSETELLGGQRTDADTLRAQLAASPGATILTMRESEIGEIIGSVWLEPSGGAAYYLGMLTVNPTRQADGLGRVLLARAESFASAAGARTMRLTVIEQRESLIAWYERRGYRRTGEVKPFPDVDERVEAPRRGDLRLLVFEKALERETPIVSSSG
jgi:ribosomal protein S18 acetylase RimI-like enzyme